MTDEKTGGEAWLNGLELSTSLTVADVQQSLDWYRDALGFEVVQRYENEGTLRAASVRAGNVRFLLGQDNGEKGWDRSKGEGMSLMITVERPVDEVAARRGLREPAWSAIPRPIPGASGLSGFATPTVSSSLSRMRAPRERHRGERRRSVYEEVTVGHDHCGIGRGIVPSRDRLCSGEIPVRVHDTVKEQHNIV